jgi:drug/metabolite transporter (DMT)-like permease
MSAFGNTRLIATLVGAIGICLWATETVLVTFTTGLPTLEIVALAFAAASLLSPLAWKLTGGKPLDAFRQPLAVWLITVPCLVLYHACIYYAVHRVPATPAALLHGATPLFIVLGSALLPGERLRWWHLAGAALGAGGMFWLVDGGSGDLAVDNDAAFYLACIGLAAGLWGVYSLVSRRFGDVPSGAMGTFYAAAAVLAGLGHLTFETWVTPNLEQVAIVLALGLLPMGLALYFWDYGVKRGDIQALGATSYVEPLIGAFLVVAAGQGLFHWSMLLAGMLIIGGSVLAAGSLWGAGREADLASANTTPARNAATVAGPIRDLTVLVGCQKLLNQRMADLLRRSVFAGLPDQEPDARNHLPLSTSELAELRRLASQALTIYSYIYRLLGHAGERDRRRFREVHTRRKALSAREFLSLTELATQAIVQLELLDRASDPSIEPSSAGLQTEDQAAWKLPTRYEAAS